MDYAGFGWGFGHGLFSVFTHVMGMLIWTVSLSITFAVLFLLVRFLLVGTRAAQLYVAQHEPQRPTATPAAPASEADATAVTAPAAATASAPAAAKNAASGKAAPKTSAKPAASKPAASTPAASKPASAKKQSPKSPPAS